jgi:hypothetical protein
VQQEASSKPAVWDYIRLLSSLENVQACVIIIARATVNIPRPLTFRNKRSGLRGLAFGIALLGLCIFAWGLKYKLSLYDPPHAVSHHMPAAKLLSGKERSFVSTLVVAPRPANSAAPLALTTLALAFLACAAGKLSAGFYSSPLARSSRDLAPASVRCAPAFIRPPPFRR